MDLEVTLESLETVPEALHELYEERDGGFHLRPIKGFVPEGEVSGLKSALAKEKDKRRSAMERLSSLPEGFDPETDLAELAELRKEREERETQKAEEKGEWEKLREKQQKAHESAIAAEQEKNSSLRQQLDTVLRKNAAVTHLNEADAFVDAALPHVMGQTKTITEGGEERVIVVDEHGERRLNKDGNDMTMAELIEEMSGVPKYACLFKGSDATGGGSPGRKGARGARSKALKDMTEAEKIAYTEEHGEEAFRKLIAAEYGQ